MHPLPLNPEPLLALFMAKESARSLAGDLEERFQCVCQRKGWASAAIWFCWALLISLPLLIIEAMRARPIGPLPVHLHPIAYFSDDSELGDKRQVTQYEIQGLPPRERAWIANFGAPYRHDWRILRATDEVQGDWIGDHQSAKDAACSAIGEVSRLIPSG
jgi:hypothetical protein